MATSRREVVDGLQEQGAGERIVWQIRLAVTPESLGAVTVADEFAGMVDVSGDVLDEVSASSDDDLVTLPGISGLTVGRIYRVSVAYDYSVHGLVDYFRVLVTA